jgi:type II secretory pathway pseudopilin PulG
MVAMAIVMTSMASLAQVFIASENVVRIARAASIGALLAQSKIEELRASGAIAPSPPDALSKDTDGYVDYLDADGALLDAASATASAAAAYTRRWAIDAMRSGPVHGITLQVLVTRSHARLGATPRGDVWLVGVVAQGRD